MKNSSLIHLLIFSLTILLFSCKKEEVAAPSQPTTNPINYTVVGTWTWTSLSQGSPGSMSSYTISPNRTITFASNGTYTSNFNFTEIGTPPALNNDNGTYTNTDSLRMQSNVTGRTIVSKVKKLTQTDLWIYYKVYWGAYNDLQFVK